MIKSVLWAGVLFVLFQVMRAIGLVLYINAHQLSAENALQIQTQFGINPVYAVKGIALVVLSAFIALLPGIQARITLPLLLLSVLANDFRTYQNIYGQALYVQNVLLPYAGLILLSVAAFFLVHFLKGYVNKTRPASLNP